MLIFLETLELRLQNLLEGTLDHLFYPGLSYSLSGKLVSMINEKIEEDSEGSKIVPDQIELRVSPDKWDAWQESRTTLDQVEKELENSWQKQGFSFINHPRIKLVPDDRLRINDIEIQTAYSPTEPGTGRTALQKVLPNRRPPSIPKGASLIVNGKDHIALNLPLVNIGRRSSSDVVINDATVSRDHLQLRAQRAHYILFDLSSMGGTYVNNKLVKSVTLKPGDVIRIGKTLLIYDQDFSATQSRTGTISIKPEETS